jgi:hypothetical protein
MIFKTISYSISELGRLSGVAKDIPRVSVYDEANYKNTIYYHPHTMRIANSTGVTVQVAPFTDLEYASYRVSGSAFSTFFPIANSTIETFDGIKRQISKLLISGSAGASSPLDVVFRYE